MSVLPVLKINSKSKIYDYIVILSKCLEIKFEEIIKQMLDILIIHAYFPDDLQITLEELSFLDESLGTDLTENIIDNIILSLNNIRNYIENLTNHEYYQILIDERQFKE